MELVHIVRETDHAAHSAASQSVINLATKQSKAGLHTKIWFVTDHPHQDYALANYEISLFPHLLNPLAIHTHLTEAIQCAKPNTIFHLHGEFSALNYLLAKVFRESGKPFVFTPNARCRNSFLVKINQKIQKVLFKNKIIKSSSAIHALCPQQALYFKKNYTNTKIYNISYGFEISQNMQVSRNNDKFICTYCLSSCTNLHLLSTIIRTFSYFLPQNPHAELWFIGRTNKKLEDLIKKHNLQNNIILWGEQSVQERNKLLSYSHLYLALSEQMWPDTALEAASLGVPLIVLSQTLLENSVQTHEAGLVLTSVNEATLLQAINELHKQISRQGVAVMGAQAQQMVRQIYDWNKILPQFYQMYINL